MGVFSFDLDLWETACATVTGCTFDKTQYVQYAIGFLWTAGTNPAPKPQYAGPYIFTMPNNPLPFEALRWHHGNPKFVTIMYGVNYDYNSSIFTY